MGSGVIGIDKARTHLRAIEEIGNPPKSEETPGYQMLFDFSDKFSEIANKEDEKVVVNLLKAFANLGLSDSKVNEVMACISEEAPQIKAHQNKPK